MWMDSMARHPAAKPPTTTATFTSPRREYPTTPAASSPQQNTKAENTGSALVLGRRSDLVEYRSMGYTLPVEASWPASCGALERERLTAASCHRIGFS